MDLLYQRYASPFSFIDVMIQTGRFYEFVVEFVKTSNKEKEEQQNWEFFLHKVWEGTYGEFKKDIEVNRENQKMSATKIETTVKDSLKILGNFKPE